MPGKIKTKRLPLASVCLGAIAVYAFFLRRRMLHWGANVQEARRHMPGDSLIPEPNYQSTRAINIHATLKDIWPWIVQIGYQRGGFYSYDWLERQAGLKGLHSADQILPAWQRIQSGDTIPISPVTPMDVAIFDPERAFVLHTVMNPFTAQIVDRALQPDTPYIDWIWAFVLEPKKPTATRLLVRVRADFKPQPLGRILSWLAIEPIHFIMENKMLQGIRARAEDNR